MTVDYQIEVDPLAINLTKPATRLGVPFMPFFASMVSCLFGWMIFQSAGSQNGLMSSVVFLAIWIGIYAFMLLKSRKDIFGLNIYFINTIYFRRHQTHRFWGNTDSYLS